MPGRHLSDAQKQSYLAYRRQGLKQYEVMRLTGISRQTAHRIEQTPAFRQAMAPYSPPDPGKPYVEPPRQMPMESAIKLLQTLRHITNPEGIQAVVNAVKDVIPGEVLADELKSLESPGLFPTGAEGSSDLPRKTPSPDDDDPERYGVLSNAVPSQAVAHNGLLKRTWSDADRHLNPVSRAQAIRAARKGPPAFGGLVFYQP